MTRRAAVVSLAIVLASCSAPAPPPEDSLLESLGLTGTPTPSPVDTTSPTPSPSPTLAEPGAALSAANVVDTIEHLVERIGRREASTAAYRRAAFTIGDTLETYGYTVKRQYFPIPEGRVDGTPVKEGRTLNVIAEPKGFDRRKPHVLVGAHLDTVPDSRGANDNASGVAVMVELARVAALRPPATPVVFVALGAEEHRRRGDGFAYGSRAYIDEMTRAQRRALKGFMNLDMVGNGDLVYVIGEGVMMRTLMRAADRYDVPVRRRYSGSSDHLVFREAGYSVGWLWSGKHPSLHTRDDDMDVIERAELRRVLRLAWGTLRLLRV